jgi:hypothetical protein
MDFIKDIENLFDVKKAIDTVEKSSTYVLGYVPNEDLRSTLQKWNQSNFEFARKNVEVLKSIQTIAKNSIEEVTNKTLKTVK